MNSATDINALLERFIKEAGEAIVNATPDKRREAWANYKLLHGQRSPEQVAKMEREKGLT